MTERTDAARPGPPPFGTALPIMLASQGKPVASPAVTVGREEMLQGDARFDVVGIGNALVDVIAHAPDSFLVDHSLVKGWMDLIDTDRAVELYHALGSAVEMSGGSAANTMCGVASFGGRAAYIGKVNDDELGEVFGHDMLAVGVQFRPGSYDNAVPTGRCIIVGFAKTEWEARHRGLQC